MINLIKYQDKIQSILDALPTKPGCYLMKDETGKVIYVGKAVNLRNRVRSYFHASVQDNIKTRHLVQRIADIEWIVVASELEALILEMNLIKQHRPAYNVLLKDDKRYPYIKVHWQDDFPKVTVTRQILQDGARYFGPYTNVWAVHQTLDFLRKLFPYLTCDRVITGKDKRACLFYDIKLCCAPCIGKTNREEYRQMIDDLCNFLEGRTEPILSRLQEEMHAAAENLNFEKAALLRDQIRSIQKVVEKQKVVSTDYLDSDVIAIARSNDDACAQVFFIRGGKLIGREYFLLKGTEDTPEEQVLSAFIKQFYSQSANIPQQVLLPHEIEEAQIIQRWLTSRRCSQNVSCTPVEVFIPREGNQQELIQMAIENAAETLTMLKKQWENDRHKQTSSLAELQQALNLPSPPLRIECYDISNTQGTYAVGSMVVFEQGVPNKKLYRRFNIKSVSGIDDFASMEEVLLRRFKRWQDYQPQHQQASSSEPSSPLLLPQNDSKIEADPAFNHLPDLLIVDGGKGQLQRAVAVLEKFNLLTQVSVISLAKKNEEIFIPTSPQPIVLDRHSQALHLLQRIRDEAHRFAIASHRKRRQNASTKSLLESIPGIGQKRRRQLLKHFGSVENIRRASIEEISNLTGFNESLAHEVKAALGEI